MKRLKIRTILTGLILLTLPFASAVGQSNNRIVVSKKNFTLCVISATNDTICQFPCAVGKVKGNKTKVGDCKTPEGTFKVIQIQNSTSWTHDFKDGGGVRQGAYGPWFIRLQVPGASGIGIHGTCFPESIGTRATEGCIRLLNEDLQKLIPYVSINMTCIIEPD